MARYTIERELAPEDVRGITDTALGPGGIGYWADLRDELVDQVPAESAGDDDPIFYVRERHDEPRPADLTADPWLAVTPAVLARGVTLVMAGVRNSDVRSLTGEADKPGWQFEPRVFEDIEDLGAMDAEEADWVVQLGLFGHLVFSCTWSAWST